MSTQNCITWIENNLTINEVQGKRIIEVGAYDVNGSVRPAVELLEPNEYIGIDMRKGPGVDVVCLAEKLVAQFGKDSFDIVISSCAFEHIKYWKQALSNIKNICKPDGIIIFIVPSQWPFHAYPNDFWRYGIDDITYIFSDFDRLVLQEIQEKQAGQALAYAKLKKPLDFSENNLENYQLYSIIADKKIAAIRKQDFFNWYFIEQVTIYMFNTLNIPRPIKYLIIYIVMGIKLKIIKPIIQFLSVE